MVNKLHGSDRCRRLADVLNTEEILAAGNALGDGSSNGVLIPGTPGISSKIALGITDTGLSNLEPVTGTIVGLDVIVGSLAHVEQRGAYVVLC